LGALDRFRLSGVIASWWTETLPDFKTLVENGFRGVIDGWIDAIGDALEDDGEGPTFDPFSHKLVLRTMADYLDRIAAARAEVAVLKGEKETFEQSNPPDDADDDELAKWNYAQDLQQQASTLRAENKDALKNLAKLERQASKTRATIEQKQFALAAKTALDPILTELTRIGAALQPYEEIKTKLSAARSLYRQLTDAFSTELKARCSSMSDSETSDLVLELFEQDVQTGLSNALTDKRWEIIRGLENLWDKYSVTLHSLKDQRLNVESALANILTDLDYA
jgi:type I restriction enzyme M protein